MNTPQLTGRQIHILKHNVGVCLLKPITHRNHYLAYTGIHQFMPDLEVLIDMGIMTEGSTPRFLDSDVRYFYATDQGKQIAIDALTVSSQ